MKLDRVGGAGSIWFYAALYFAFYIPYSGLTKALSRGMLPGFPEDVPGAMLLPVTTAVSLVVAIAFLSAMRWWRFATHRRVLGRSVPVPTRWTALSGLCTAVILTTTTLAYTFEGVSIVFVMLLMRGGVLIIAPIVDAVSGRDTRWFSWVGLALSFTALLVAFAEEGGYALTLASGVDVGLYLAAYFVRLGFMSRLAKTDDADVTRRYFVEEQLVAVPVTLLVLVAAALIGYGAFMQQVRAGFTTFLDSGLVLETAVIGVLSQAVGIFGTLVYLDKSENTFSVPVNRCSSILSGVVASFALALLLDAAWPSAHQLIGAGLVVGAILILGLAPVFERKKDAVA